jgi:hypothetical protein
MSNKVYVSYTIEEVEKMLQLLDIVTKQGVGIRGAQAVSQIAVMLETNARDSVTAESAEEAEEVVEE